MARIDFRHSGRQHEAKGIPTLYGVDAIHGATYTSGAAQRPQQLALAATWDTSLVRKIRGHGAGNHGMCIHEFRPVLDVGVTPVATVLETKGELQLVGDMGEAMVRGFKKVLSRWRPR